MHAETLGFDGFFVSDHYHVMGENDPRNGPTDAMTTLAGIARDTKKTSHRDSCLFFNIQAAWATFSNRCRGRSNVFRQA